jgi:hypothetical protein
LFAQAANGFEKLSFPVGRAGNPHSEGTELNRWLPRYASQLNPIKIASPTACLNPER